MIKTYSPAIPQDVNQRYQKMVATDHSAIKKLLDLYANVSPLAELGRELDEVTRDGDSAQFIALYQRAIPYIEEELWASNVSSGHLDYYHAMFRELEQLIASKGEDRRYNFTVVIPVADRPQHLASCLDSLLSVCRHFHYGGFKNQKYDKIQVIIADDSKQEENIQAHQQIASQMLEQGLQTVYFGLSEQIKQINKISDEGRRQLSAMLGAFDSNAFYHKGASIMRNITYLKLNDISKDQQPRLFYFIDSDQEFRVKTQSEQGEQDVYAINYFYHLDQIFRNNDVSVLTGKVVGDPPVSPAVMAANFLDDVISFLLDMSKVNARDSCQFHEQHSHHDDDASYHDMADLFGFKAKNDSYSYHCTIESEHDHVQCFSDFAEKLNRFFYGEHPTRKSYYKHQNLYHNIKPARTVYTGNYIFKPHALRYFIPFATLNLRMAGPVLGRIIQADISEQFVSANLPMLHKRTVEDIGQSEFRPGVKQKQSVIDLSGEFERQFFGDVMLFTMEILTGSGYPRKNLADEIIESTLSDINQSLHQKYEAKHRQIMAKMAKLKTVFQDSENWWNKDDDLDEAKDNIKQFILNIEHNFGEQSRAYEIVNDSDNNKKRNQQILNAIKTYAKDQLNWNQWALELDG